MSVRRDLSETLLDKDYVIDLWCKDKSNVVGFNYCIIDGCVYVDDHIIEKGKYFINPFQVNEHDMIIVSNLSTLPKLKRKYIAIIVSYYPFLNI